MDHPPGKKRWKGADLVLDTLHRLATLRIRRTHADDPERRKGLTLRIAIYARVSKDDGIQDTENQLVILREFAERKGWDVAKEYVDHQSAKTENRPQLQEMFKDAARHKFDIVLVWALDRFTRGGVLTAFAAVERLKNNGVEFWSYSEEFFRTMGPAGELMFAIVAWMAKQERTRISERTRAGLDRVKAKGRILGRPRVDVDMEKVKELRSAGKSTTQISGLMGLKRSRVFQAMQQAGIAGARPARSLEIEEPEEDEQDGTDAPETLQTPPDCVPATVAAGSALSSPVPRPPEDWL